MMPNKEQISWNGKSIFRDFGSNVMGCESVVLICNVILRVTSFGRVYATL